MGSRPGFGGRPENARSSSLHGTLGLFQPISRTPPRPANRRSANRTSSATAVSVTICTLAPVGRSIRGATTVRRASTDLPRRRCAAADRARPTPGRRSAEQAAAGQQHRLPGVVEHRRSSRCSASDPGADPARRRGRQCPRPWIGRAGGADLLVTPRHQGDPVHRHCGRPRAPGRAPIPGPSRPCTRANAQPAR